MHVYRLKIVLADQNIHHDAYFPAEGCAGSIALMGEMRNAYKILVGKPERKRPCRRPGHRWEYNIRMVLGK
jgi:hypothetical protein